MTKLTREKTMPMTLGQSRVKPSASFSAVAHTISKRPAPIRINQATIGSPFSSFVNGLTCCDPSRSGGEATVDGDRCAGYVASTLPGEMDNGGRYVVRPVIV